VQNQDRLIDLGLQVGLGWFYAPEKLGGRFDIIGHDGRTIAHSAQLATAPDAGLGVAILSNSADNSGVMSKIAKEAMKMLYATLDIPELPQDSMSPVIAQLETSTDLAGDYAGPFDLIQIKPDGKYFTANALGMDVSLRPAQNNLYSVRLKLGGLSVLYWEIKSLPTHQPRNGTSSSENIKLAIMPNLNC